MTVDKKPQTSAARDIGRASPLLVGLLALAGAFGCTGAAIQPGPDDPQPEVQPEPEVQTVTRVVASAGADREVLEGSRVVLDGEASRSLEGELALTWSQTQGPPVLLTNPSGAAPAFIAPLGPDVLTFRLRAESGFEGDIDEVTIFVSSRTPTLVPFYTEVPPDRAAAVGDDIDFDAVLVGSRPTGATFSARSLCTGTSVSVSATGRVTGVIGNQLPCAIAVEVTSADNVQSSRATYVLWPLGTPLPPPTTLLQTPSFLVPGETSSLRYDAAALAEVGATPRTWAPSGLLLINGLSTATDVPFTAPLLQGRITLHSETRLGTVSGGIQTVLVEVSSGPGNRSPVADGGLDREVAPGGSFALNTSGSYDLDGDPIAVRALQVLGQQAEYDPLQPFAFQAPPEEGVLLFHIIANDGVVDSRPATVRVFVLADAANTPPVLSIAPVRYVQPNLPFTLDASGAQDSSGVVDAYAISQEPSDPVILLDAPVETASATLTAGEEGDVYHFRLSAFDVEGLRGFADVEVRVERAGPYVDPIRGTPEGDGTVDFPFSTLTGALDVASRHQLPELRLAATSHSPWSGELPAGLSLRGGFEFDGSGYVEAAGGETIIPVGGTDFVVTNGVVSMTSLLLTSPDSAVRLRDASALVDVRISENGVHTGPMLVVEGGASASMERGEIRPSTEIPNDETLSVVDVDGSEATTPTTFDLVDVQIIDGKGGNRTGVSCQRADLIVRGGSIVGGFNTTSAVGIAATDCSLDLLGAFVAGGVGETAMGLDLQRTTTFVDDQTITAAVFHSEAASLETADAVSNATAIRQRGDAPSLLSGTVHSSLVAVVEPPLVAIMPTTSVGVDTASTASRINFMSLDIRAETDATAIAVFAPDVQLADVDIVTTVEPLEPNPEAKAIGIAVSSVQLFIERATLTTTAPDATSVRGLIGPDNVGVRILDSVAVSTGTTVSVGYSLPNAKGVIISGGSVRAEAGSDQAQYARGISFGQGTVNDVVVEAVATNDASGIILGSGEQQNTVSRVTVRVESTLGVATALFSAGTTHVNSSALAASNRDLVEQAIALESRGPLVLRHGTLFSTGVALRAPGEESALSLANSAFAAPTALSVDGFTPAITDNVGLAFDSAVIFDDETTAITDVNALVPTPCTGCIAFTRAVAFQEDTYRLQTGPNPLVDVASAAFADSNDIDGDARPVGTAPDIGADERAP